MKNIAILLALALISACKKGQAEFTVKGFVFDATYSKLLPNAKIDVTKRAAGSNEKIHVTTIYSDSEGNYSFDVSRERFVNLELTVVKEGYFSVDKIINFSDLTLNTDNYANFSVTGKSWVKIHLVHTDSPATKLDIVKTKGKSACQECCPDGYQQLQGIVDTVFYCANDANTVYEFTYFKQFSSFSGTKSVQTPFMDTVEIFLEY